MSYLPLTLTAGELAGCTDTSCGHWVGTPHYSGPYMLEVERAIVAWASIWQVEMTAESFLASLLEEAHRCP